MGNFYRKRGKRLFDVLGASAALVASSPVQLVAAGTIRWKMGAPVLFRQERPGRDGRPFTLLKFRTMTDAVRADGSLRDDEERLTRLGRLLRSTSVDELPELWNVLRGDMSLVGPRPLLMQYLPRYTAAQARRHGVRPGITGWAQVHGRNGIPWAEKFEMDVWYVDNASLRVDLSVLIATVRAVLLREGIEAEGYATAPEFMALPAE
jgi:lipopolysaccharide/colanic/teichoic acid biosynthesis glycosyltransferase